MKVLSQCIHLIKDTYELQSCIESKSVDESDLGVVAILNAFIQRQQKEFCSPTSRIGFNFLTAVKHLDNYNSPNFFENDNEGGQSATIHFLGELLGSTFESLQDSSERHWQAMETNSRELHTVLEELDALQKSRSFYFDVNQRRKSLLARRACIEQV